MSLLQCWNTGSLLAEEAIKLLQRGLYYWQDPPVMQIMICKIAKMQGYPASRQLWLQTATHRDFHLLLQQLMQQLNV